MAAMQMRQAMHRGQTQADRANLPTRREERLEDTLVQRQRDPRPLVAHRQADEIAGDRLPT